MQNHPIRLVRFAAAHYPEYRRWFADPAIKEALYGIDETWLGYILENESGAEYAAFSGEEMLAVVGIVYPTADHPNYVITNLAVRPGDHRSGTGSLVLKTLLDQYPLTRGQSWLAFVELKNRPAQNFFAANDWQCGGLEPDGEMMRYELAG